METETQTTTYITSQGEIVRTEKEAVTITEKTVKMDEKKDETTHTGVLDELWHTVKDKTEAAAHMAEMVGVIAGEAALSVKEATSGFIEKGMEKAHEASEKIAEKTSELVEKLHIEPSEVRPVSKQLEALAEIIIEQSKISAEQARQAVTEAIPPSVTETVSEAVEATKETLSEAVDVAKDIATEVVNTVQQATQEVTAPVQEALAQEAPAQEVSLPRSRSFKKSASKQSVNESEWQGTLTLTMDVVSHIQRIADRTGDAVLHETARRAHSACAKGLSEAPGVHLTWVTPQQANDLVNLAIRTQDHELADFARYCQSVAATSHIAVEPTPGKIQEEILKGHQELQNQGRMHTGPGYGAAFASVNKNYNIVDGEGTQAPPPSPADATQPQQPLQRQPSKTLVRQPSLNQQQMTPPNLVLSMDVVSHIQRIADRTGNPVLHDTARKAHSAFAKGLNDAPGVHLTWITPLQAAELMNLASRTSDKELVDFARYCQSVAATTQIGVEPLPGKIQQEIFKGRMEIQTQLKQQEQQQQQVQAQAQQAGGGSF